MTPFFKKIALLSMFSSILFCEEQSVIKVEVATIVWDEITVDESFDAVSNYQLVKEALVLEEYQEPEFNFDTLELESNITFDFNFLEVIPEFLENPSNEEEEKQVIYPSFFRVIDRSEHELNGTMRRISQVDGLELNNHKSWYQPLGSEQEMPYILVSSEDNQCVVKVFQSRYPRVHAKCAMGPDALSSVSLINKSEYRIRELLGEDFDRSKATDESESSDEVKILYLLDEQRRIKLDEFHYFDHPKVGLLVGVYKYPKEED